MAYIGRAYVRCQVGCIIESVRVLRKPCLALHVKLFV